MNIGYRPTVNGKERRIEVNIFDFNEDIYDRTICVELIAFIRNEMKFSGLDALKAQLAADKEQISLIHEELKN
jgi:riboflavin kinase/FMN adenylyltransferase